MASPLSSQAPTAYDLLFLLEPAEITYSILQSECRNLHYAARSLASCLRSSLQSCISHKEIPSSSVVYVNSLSLWLDSITSTPSHTGIQNATDVRVLGVYADAALKLVMLMGEIEDYFEDHENMKFVTELKKNAIDALKQVECRLSEISKLSPEWGGFVKSADERIDEALTFIKGHAASQFRNFLGSLNISLSNPYLAPIYDRKTLQMFRSFCQFQRLYTQRRSHLPLPKLWAILELANHLLTSCKERFLKWADSPKLIFDFAIQVCKDYVAYMDQTLQPIVDETELLNFKCIEEWVYCWTDEFSSFLGEKLLPRYKNRTFIEALDLMVNFDRQINTLLPCYLVRKSLHKVSSFSFAMNRPELIETWAKLEVEDSTKKVARIFSDEKIWKDVNFTVPAVAGACVRILSSAVDKRRWLPARSEKEKFLAFVGMPFVRVFLEGVRTRCIRAEERGTTEGMIEICRCLKLVLVFECVLRKEYEGSCLVGEIEHFERTRVLWVERLECRVYESGVSSDLVEPLGFEDVLRVLRKNWNSRAFQ